MPLPGGLHSDNFHKPLSLSGSMSMLLSLLLRTSVPLLDPMPDEGTTMLGQMSRVERQTGEDSPLRDRCRMEATRGTEAMPG